MTMAYGYMAILNNIACFVKPPLSLVYLLVQPLPAKPLLFFRLIVYKKKLTSKG